MTTSPYCEMELREAEVPAAAIAMVGVMAIEITKSERGYGATVTPPHGGGRPGRLSLVNPVSLDEVIAALRERAAASEASATLYEADPTWDQEPEG
jgi:hypothetical protein